MAGGRLLLGFDGPLVLRFQNGRLASASLGVVSWVLRWGLGDRPRERGRSTGVGRGEARYLGSVSLASRRIASRDPEIWPTRLSTRLHSLSSAGEGCDGAYSRSSGGAARPALCLSLEASLEEALSRALFHAPNSCSLLARRCQISVPESIEISRDFSLVATAASESGIAPRSADELRS